jgi:hypothetical protein
MPLVNTVLADAGAGPPPAALQYAYIYQAGLNQGERRVCSRTCSVFVDPRLGDFFYQFLAPAQSQWKQREMNQDVPSGRANPRF